MFANLAGIALDRSELLHREELRSHDELLLNQAVRELGRSLELDDVYRAIVAQAATVSGMTKVCSPARSRPAATCRSSTRRACRIGPAASASCSARA